MANDQKISEGRKLLHLREVQKLSQAKTKPWTQGSAAKIITYVQRNIEAEARRLCAQQAKSWAWQFSPPKSFAPKTFGFLFLAFACERPLGLCACSEAARQKLRRLVPRLRSNRGLGKLEGLAAAKKASLFS